jgi:GNAT superfamily N-acetyltransferase
VTCPFLIEPLGGDAMAEAIPDLAELLRACVLDGASIGFVLPFPIEDAARFWRDQTASVLAGGRRILVARQGERIVGTVQVVLESLPNARHRAGIAKLLVHPEARRLGLGRALMQKAEAVARDNARSLLILDTRQGDPSETLYRALGFAVTGIVPGYACSIFGAPEACTFMHKTLSAEPPARP